jgi:[acyl-carrier-protein] S-malonyltransferase
MIAFVFPGQGSQKIGMGASWVSHPAFELVNEASHILNEDVEYLLLKADIDHLTSTDNAQLATFLQSLIVLDAVERMGFEPVVVAGHSLGEYTALVAGGAISFEDGLKLVKARGNAMKKATDIADGSMAAILGTELKLAEIACSLAGIDCVVANDNSSNQIVISGPSEEIDKALIYLKQFGAKKTVKLQVGGAFHSRLMAPARSELINSLLSVNFRDSSVPIITNIDALPHINGEDFFLLEAAQLTSRVRWRETMQQLSEMSVSAIVELGPGSVLTGLSKREPYLKNVQCISIETPEDLDKLLRLTDPDIANLDDEIKQDIVGESLYTKLRVILSPASGTFIPNSSFEFANKNPEIPFEKILKNLVILETGDIIGNVDSVPILSPFKGILKGLLAIPSRRVEKSEPLFWLVTTEQD